MKRKRTITEQLGPVLTGMETDVLRQVEAAAVFASEELSLQMLDPLGDVSGKAGKMERESPLFKGTGQNPCLW